MATGGVNSVGANQQVQLRKLERVDFTDDAGRTRETFDNVRVNDPADTNKARRGYGIDLDGDGKYTDGKDGVLVFDLDGDGKYSASDVENTQKYLRALAGEEDLDGDGKVSFQEKKDAHNFKQQFGSADLDQDGVLSGWEISELGGMVVKLGRDSEGEPSSTIVSLPGFEADRMPPKPNIMDPSTYPPNPEFEAWRNQMWSQWSNVLGMDLMGYFGGGSAGQGGGGAFNFPPITAGMFGGGPAFPQFNFAQFDPMAGQSFDMNGFPSFFSSGVPFL